MGLLRKIRFSMGTTMMFVLMMAAAMALFVKIYGYADELPPGWKVDVPSLFLLAIGLTALALGSWKEHSASQIMLQVALACVGCLTLIWIGEAKYERAIRYWCQGVFAATVTLPMLARRFIKASMPRGPRRDRWKKTCEAVFFSFLTMMLVTAGGLVQAGVYALATNLPTPTAPVPLPAAPIPLPAAPMKAVPAPSAAIPDDSPPVPPEPAPDDATAKP